MIKILMLFAFFSNSAYAGFLTFEVFGELGVGDADISESVSGTPTYEHSTFTLFAGAGARGGISILDTFMGGVTVGYNRMQIEMSREEVGGSILDTDGYDNSLAQVFWGYWVGMQIPGTSIRVFGELYDEVEGTVKYAEAVGENIFTKNDELVGDGHGLGVSFRYSSHIIMSAMWRHFEYTKWSSGGTEITIPNTQYTIEFSVDQVSMQAGVYF